VTFIACTPPREQGWAAEHLGAMPPPPNLILLGRLPRAELPAVLRGCDIFASCSVNDPCPNAVIEAMACGLPVWYHPSGGTPELVGSCGLPFSGDPESDLKKLLENRETFSQAARERAEKLFNIRHTAQQYLEAAEALVRKKRRGKRARTLYRKLLPLRMVVRSGPTLPILRVGYYLPCELSAYENVPASIWIRCFQMIKPLSELGIKVLINPKPETKIDLAVILRLETEHGVEIARLFKNRSIPYIMDMVVNYLDVTTLPYDHSLRVTEEQSRSTTALIAGATMVTTVSPWLADRVSSYHPWTVCVSDAVPDAFFEISKEEREFYRKDVRACFVGVSAKSGDLMPWLPALQENGVNLMVLSEEEPTNLGRIRCKKWTYASFADDIVGNEIGLAPRRDPDNSYNKGHSAFRIASLLACGIPVIASPVPSYSPFIADGEAGRIVHDPNEFAATLEKLLSDRRLLCRMSAAARERVRPLAVSNVARELAQVFRQTIALAGD
jgi:hypothetical protein